MKSIRSRRPRAVLAARIYAPESAAAAFRLAAMTRAWVDAGIGVEVLTTAMPAPGLPAGRFQTKRPRPGLRIRRWPVKRDATGTVRGYVEYCTFDIPLALRLLLAPWPDVIVAEPPPTTGLVALIAARLRRVPFAYIVPDVWKAGAAAAGAPGLVVSLLGAVENTVLREADLLLVTSGEWAAEALAAGARPERVVDIGNGADDSIFTPHGERIETEGPLFVHAGTLSEWQGCDVLIRAMPQVLKTHPSARLVFLGDGSERAELERLAAELVPEAIEFHGRVAPSQAATWLRSATVGIACARPGIGYSGARPTKAFAGAACGTPVLYVGEGPLATEVPADGIGRSARYDPADVAAALTDMASHPAGTSEREHIAAWTKQHASLSAVGERATWALTQLLRIGINWCPAPLLRTARSRSPVVPDTGPPRR